ncbi:hypothetical protein SAMN05421820_12113 [Pedobacter steynii]|uniref:Lipoprotein n=2 Tax=Pedobacter steynii TaxID=430522 RepID=A0A1H0M805_9SPHI|nr:hypothetical protein SAMN05421820_12113 [Pedobacter steynii]
MQMKKIFPALIAIVVLLAGCATVQSLIKSTFPYTATVVIPASSKSNTTISANSAATSFDQVFGNQNGTDYVKEIRIASAKLDASNPSNKSLGMFKSVKLFVTNDKGTEVMVASRNDVQENIGPGLVLDIDNSRFLDNYVKGTSLRIRMEYVLRDNTATDVSVRVSLSFSTSPKTAK